MKLALKILGAIVGVFVLLLLATRVTGFEPRECASGGVSWTCRLPGLWLRGDTATTPVNDWTFTDNYQTVKVQTRDPLLGAYSVTTYCVAYNDQLYLTSVYAPGLPPFPHGRHWNENVARDPHVRLKIGDKLYDRTLSVVTDPTERAAVIQAKAKKYPKQVIAPGSQINVFHVMPD